MTQANAWDDEGRFCLTGRLHPSDEVAIREAETLLADLPIEFEFREPWRQVLAEFVQAAPGAERTRARAAIAALHEITGERSLF